MGAAKRKKEMSVYSMYMVYACWLCVCVCGSNFDTPCWTNCLELLLAELVIQMKKHPKYEATNGRFCCCCCFGSKAHKYACAWISVLPELTKQLMQWTIAQRIIQNQNTSHTVFTSSWFKCCLVWVCMLFLCASCVMVGSLYVSRVIDNNLLLQLLVTN